jgi:hypothetical protein
MDSLVELIKVVIPWFVWLVFVLIAFKMFDWARHRKARAIAFGLFVQMFLLKLPSKTL